jgi:hypothetical protein
MAAAFLEAMATVFACLVVSDEFACSIFLQLKKI